ncbi:MAG: hypothetical protein MJ237_08015 [bacterium]|nr:hypothetical protein [bacterium]
MYIYNGNFSEHRYGDSSALTFSSSKSKKKHPVEEIASKIDEEKSKKRTKRAFAVGGGVVALSLIVAIFNPHVSTKLITNLKELQNKVNIKVKKSKGDLLASKFYKVVLDGIDWFSRFLSYSNNINSVKDTYFLQLCTEEKSFTKIRNKAKKERLQKVDNVVRKIFKKPHLFITKLGDKLAVHTVNRSYRIAEKDIQKLENFINEHKSKLPSEQKLLLEKKLSELSGYKEYLQQESISARLHQQESCMANLNTDIRSYFQKYRHGFLNHYVENRKHFNENLSFWAQDMLQSEKDKIVQKGEEFVGQVMGTTPISNGGYKDIVEILSSNLDKSEVKSLNKYYNNAKNSLIKANKNECVEYFDKKRDLTLGSAPTDIVTAILGLSAGGLAIAMADDKDKKISHLITGVIPAIMGIGTNIVLTSMLFSGIKGIAIGALTGGVFSICGSKINKARLNAKGKTDDEEETEVSNA